MVPYKLGLLLRSTVPTPVRLINGAICLVVELVGRYLPHGTGTVPYLPYLRDIFCLREVFGTTVIDASSAIFVHAYQYGNVLIQEEQEYMRQQLLKESVNKACRVETPSNPVPARIKVKWSKSGATCPYTRSG